MILAIDVGNTNIVFGAIENGNISKVIHMHTDLTYTTEETEKLEVMQRTAQLGGDIEAAIRQLAMEKRKDKLS